MCEPLAPLADHFFTTRSWRLGGRGSSTDSGWSEVASAVPVDDAHLARLHQVHKADVVSYRKGSAAPSRPYPSADIVLTDDPAVAVALQTADCLPVLVADGRSGAVAAAHAGWRGLAAGVPRVTVAAMAKEFESRAEDLHVAIGPAIGACCYEVGEDVRRRFIEAGFEADEIARWFLHGAMPSPRNPSMASLTPPARPGRWFFDGWRCAREQLVTAGIPESQIFTADCCTASHAGAFCSYRRDGGGTGRQAAVIRPRPSPRSPGDPRAR